MTTRESKLRATIADLIKVLHQAKAYPVLHDFVDSIEFAINELRDTLNREQPVKKLPSVRTWSQLVATAVQSARQPLPLPDEEPEKPNGWTVDGLPPDHPLRKLSLTPEEQTLLDTRAAVEAADLAYKPIRAELEAAFEARKNLLPGEGLNYFTVMRRIAVAVSANIAGVAQVTAANYSWYEAEEAYIKSLAIPQCGNCALSSIPGTRCLTCQYHRHF